MLTNFQLIMCYVNIVAFSDKPAENYHTTLQAHSNELSIFSF